ncbi:Fatty acid desaturase [Pseudobythopirellula maris]|uniref:Fatty acid desaturase n=1 Tax=Pseudobythopirellula maris TaxID=2527991 RepID=A0A5C5ZLS3_9BACT|nr:fatty acid desaturase [Pseudobythopirellula maris]TWT88349.1 Fatty acid desaturase [Pseudobythopirellula maris]
MAGSINTVRGAADRLAATAIPVDLLPPPATSPAALARPAAASHQIAWRYAVPIVAIHALALLAFVPWLFSWTGLVLCLAGAYVYGGLGINIGYHRLLTHRSFRCPLWLERTCVVTAICCLEDAPASWVAAHRLHHRDSDEQPDPHSPLVSFFWSHIGWLLVKNPAVHSLGVYDRYARDVLRDPFYMWLQRGMNAMWVYAIHLLAHFLIGLGLGYLVAGTAMGGLQLGASLVVWAVLLRTVLVWHITWSVNSLTHLFGYRTYDTDENSRNNWFVALVSSGEGWHNNHHADQSSASNWRRWWEIDLIWLVILLWERLGLAWDVVRPRHQRRPASR